MAWKIAQEMARGAWALARRQHWVVTRQQLLRIGYTGRAIDVRVESGRLHPIHAGVYVSVPCGGSHPRRRGIRVHRRTTALEVRIHLERAINEAAILDLVHPERLRAELPSGRGARKVARLLDRDSFVVTENELEQAFVPIAHAAGLTNLETQVHTDGGRVDFLCRDLGVVIEADGLRFHRTASQQSNDLARTHRNALADLLTLRFSHWQIFHEPEYVREVLSGVAARKTLHKAATLHA